MNVQKTEAEWAVIVDDFKKSGQTQTDFCRERDINVKTFGNHLRPKPKRPKTTKRSEDEWKRLIAGQQASGMNRAAWCRERGISPDSMSSAEKRMNARALAMPIMEWVSLAPGGGVAGFTGQNEAKNGCIRFRGGDLELEADEGYPVEKLVALVGGLLRR